MARNLRKGVRERSRSASGESKAKGDPVISWARWQGKRGTLPETETFRPGKTRKERGRR